MSLRSDQTSFRASARRRCETTEKSVQSGCLGALYFSFDHVVARLWSAQACCRILEIEPISSAVGHQISRPGMAKQASPNQGGSKLPHSKSRREMAILQVASQLAC